MSSTHELASADAPTARALQQLLAKADAKVAALAARVGPAYLHASRAGRYPADAAEWWTSGFWGGMLMLVYQRSRDPRWLALATDIEAGLEAVLGDDRVYDLHHDVGFQFQPTAVMRYKLTGDPVARRRAFLATAMLMSRFNPAGGGFLEAWNHDRTRGLSIIDTMMNLPLLFWAAETFQQPRFRFIAEIHAERAQRHFVRADGSTHHIIRFDQTTGERIEALGGQGYAPESCWSRGQSWALYGFTLAYRYTQRPDFLATAVRVANSFVSQLPTQLVPPWDFRAPDADQAPRDSSAGATAASGLLELARLTGNVAFADTARRLLLALGQHASALDDPDHDALLTHATGKLPDNINVDVSLIYGDFYFLEALGKASGVVETCW